MCPPHEHADNYRFSMKIIESDRLLLRHFVPEDLDALFALYRDPEVTRYIPDAPRTYEEAREELIWHMFGHPHHPQLGLWATIHKPSGAFIGRCGLLPWTMDGQFEVEVAYLISRPFWGQGLGTEAAQAILAYGFEQLALSRLICVIDARNRASLRVAAKIGMTFERAGQDKIGPYWLYARNRIGAASG
jgi:ribosomal-protein-alanine N-acetyltransferase